MSDQSIGTVTAPEQTDHAGHRDKAGRGGVRLEVDNGTHSGTITRLQSVPGASLFVTAGNDKRIRTWAGPDPTLIRTLIGDIGPGRDGEVQAIAVQGESGLLWAAIRRTTNTPGAYRSELRQFDVVTGELLYAVNVARPIKDLAVTPDGHHLIVADEQAVQVWDVSGVDHISDAQLTQVAETENLADPYRLAVVDLGDRIRIFVSSIWRSQPRMLDFAANQLVDIPFAAADPLPHRPDQIAASDRYVAVANHDGGDLSVYDLDGNPVASLGEAGGGGPAELAFSSDGRMLIVGSKSGPDSVVTVHDVDADFALVGQRTFDDDALAAGFLDTGIAVSAGGSRFEIATWPVQNLSPRPFEAGGGAAVDAMVAGAGQVITAVGIAEPRVALGVRSDDDDDLQIRMDFETLAVGPIEEPDGAIRRAVHQDGDRTLSMSGNHNLILGPGGWPMTGHNVFAWDYAESYSLLEHDRVATGGRSGAVRVLRWDDHGRLNGRKLIGHIGKVLDLAAGERWMVTGGRDQIARLWYLPDAMAESPTPDDHAEALEPALSLFVAGREWVVWTPSGFYASSAEGERFITFHANRGFGRRAWAFPADRFVDLLYRPDIIRAVFRTGSEERALDEIHVEPITMSDHLPPVVEAHDVAEIEPYLFQLDFIVTDLASAATRVWVLLDGLIEWEQDVRDMPAGPRGSRSFSPQVWLEPGHNELRILAESDKAKSIAVDVVVTVDDAGHRAVVAPSELVVSASVESMPSAMPAQTAGTAPLPAASPATTAVPSRPPSDTPTAVVVTAGSPPQPVIEHATTVTGTSVTTAELSIGVQLERLDSVRHLRAERDGDPVWSATVDAGVSMSLRSIIPIPGGRGAVQIVDVTDDDRELLLSAHSIAVSTDDVVDRSIDTRSDIDGDAKGLVDVGAEAGGPPRPDPLGPDPRSALKRLSLRGKSEDEPNGESGSSGGGPESGSTRSTRPRRVLPELFVLAIGVSELKKKGQSVGDLQFAAADATAMEERFRSGSTGLFHNVHSWVLTDTKTTKAGIEAARDELVQAVTARSQKKRDERLKARDVVLLFFSGHGVTRPASDGGRDSFYLVTHDFLSENAEGTGVLFADMVRPFFALRDVELVVLIDACRSGHAGLDFIARVDPEELAKRLKAPSEQAQHFLCSTSGDQLSYEYELPYPYTQRRGRQVGHGLFSHAILKKMDEASTVSMSGLASGVGEALHTWTWSWDEERQEPTQYLYGGGKYLRLYRKR